MNLKSFGDNQLYKRMLRFAQVLTYIPLAIGILALLGWEFNIEFFKRPIPGLVAMNPGTALLFVLTSTIFILTRKAKFPAISWVIGSILNLALILLPFTHFVLYLLNIDSGLDQILFRQKLLLEQGVSLSNRMAPNTAICFTMIGVAYLFLDAEKPEVRNRGLFIVVVVWFLGMLSLLGYIYSVDEYHKMLSRLPMAIHTAIGFMFISAAILFNYPSTGLMGVFSQRLAGSTMALRLSPIGNFIPIVLGYLALSAYFQGAISAQLTVTLIIIGIMVTFITMVWITAKILNKKDAQRKLAEYEVSIINKDLHDKVLELEFLKNKLESSLEKEMELNELKSRFVSMASHEFRTPLATMSSSLDLANRYLSMGETAKQQRHLGKIKKAIQNFNFILDDFLSLSKLEEGRIHRNLVSFNLPDYLEEVLEDFQPYLKEGQSVVVNNTIKDEIILDTNILRNILYNLISNASKYSESNMDIYLNVSMDSFIKFTVKDQGIGISESEQKHMFERFFRASNVENIQGTGLGLNIVSKYVDLLEGKIHFESKVNQGTSFTIQLPIFPKEYATQPA